MVEKCFEVLILVYEFDGRGLDVIVDDAVYLKSKGGLKEMFHDGLDMCVRKLL